MTVTQADLALSGVNVSSYTISGFSYNSTTHTAHWSLSSPLGLDLVILGLDGSSAGGVRTAGGTHLLGGNFLEGLNVLPGDVNGDGVVNVTDGFQIRTNNTPANAYSAFNDMNGDGSVTNADFLAYRPFIGTSEVPEQLASGGVTSGGALLTQDALAPVLVAAIDQWEAAGLSAADVALLRGVSTRVTTLPVGYLGAASIGGNTIFLSADAAGHGWSLDPSVSSGGEDLLTVVMHELGHTLGLNDLNPSQAAGNLMSTTLASGVRRLPSAQDVAALTQSLVAGLPAVPLTVVANGPGAASTSLLVDGQGTTTTLEAPATLPVVPAAPPDSFSTLAALLSRPEPLAPSTSDANGPLLFIPMTAGNTLTGAIALTARTTDDLFLDVALSVAGDAAWTQPDPWTDVFGDNDA